MEAKYCDKCKKSFPKDETTEIMICGLYKNEDQNLDLCGTCRKSLCEWVDTFKVE